MRFVAGPARPRSRRARCGSRESSPGCRPGPGIERCRRAGSARGRRCGTSGRSATSGATPSAVARSGRNRSAVRCGPVVVARATPAPPMYNSPGTPTGMGCPCGSRTYMRWLAKGRPIGTIWSAPRAARRSRPHAAVAPRHLVVAGVDRRFGQAERVDQPGVRAAEAQETGVLAHVPAVRPAGQDLHEVELLPRVVEMLDQGPEDARARTRRRSRASRRISAYELFRLQQQVARDEDEGPARAQRAHEIAGEDVEREARHLQVRLDRARPARRRPPRPGTR